MKSCGLLLAAELNLDVGHDCWSHAEDGSYMFTAAAKHCAVGLVCSSCSENDGPKVCLPGESKCMFCQIMQYAC